MTNRGSILLAIGMLVLGLILGGASGGVAGFFLGRNAARPFVGQFAQPFNPNNQPFAPNGQPRNPNVSPFNQNPQGGVPFAQGAITGARVTDVEANSASDKAGLKPDDIITAVAGTKIDANHSLADLIKAHKPGDKVDLTVTRGNQTLTITVELGASPSDSNTAYLGIRYAPVTAQSQGGRRFQ